MLVSVAVYQGWPGYDLMWRWGTLSPPAAREGAALSELPLTGGRSRLHAELSRAADRWSDGSIKPFRDGPRDRGCWEGSQSPPGPCSLSLAPGQMEWLGDTDHNQFVGHRPLIYVGTGEVPKLQAHALMKVTFNGRLNNSSSLRPLGPWASILDKPTREEHIKPTDGWNRWVRVQPKCHLLNAIDYYIHLESDANLALDTSYWSQRFIDFLNQSHYMIVISYGQLGLLCQM